MAVLSVFWFDEDHWRERLDAAGGLRDLAAAVAGLFLFHPDQRRATLEELALPAGVVGMVEVADDEPPHLFLGDAPRLLHWAHGRLTAEVPTEDLADWFDEFGGERGDDHDRPVSICSVNSEHPDRLDVTTLAGALEVILGNRRAKRADLPHGDELSRTVRVPYASDCLVVSWRNSLFLPVTFDEPQRLQVLADLTPGATRRRSPPGPADDAPEGLSVRGFRFGFEEPLWVPAGPGVSSVLFGRNGAGKTLVLESVGVALGRLTGAPFTVTGSAGLAERCHVVLGSSSSEATGRVFRLVLTHLGWSPMSGLHGAETHRQITARLSGWSDFGPRPSHARGLSVAQLGDRPAEELRATLVNALIATAPWPDGPDARALTEAMIGGSSVAVDPRWAVALAVLPDEAGVGLRAHAETFLARFRGGDYVSGGDLSRHVPVVRLAEALCDGSSAPVFSDWVELVGVAGGVDEHGTELGIDPASGWLDAGRELAELLQGSLPRPVRFEPEPGDGDARVETALLAAMAHLRGAPEGADDSHPFAETQFASRIAALLGDTATGLLPRFVRDEFRIRVELLPPVGWHRRRVATLLVREDGTEIALAVAPAGMRAWGWACLRFAEAQLLQANWSGRHEFFGPFTWSAPHRWVRFGDVEEQARGAFAHTDPASLTFHLPAAAPVLYLLDEPEAHLHLTAQSDAAEATAELARTGSGALVATHSLAYVDAGPATSVLTMTASAGAVEGVAVGGLRSLVDRAEALGVRPSALAQVCRGVLVVEGANDAYVLERYGGVDLDQHFVVVTPIGGHEGAPNTADLEFLHSLRVPIFVLLDHVRRSLLEAALRSGPKALGAEERSLVALHRLLRDRGLGAWALPFAKLDIVRAIPESEITWAVAQVGGAPFPGWAELDRAAESRWRADQTKFKDAFAAETGVSVERVIATLLAAKREKMRSPELHGLLAAMLDAPAEPPGPGLTVLDPHR